MNIVLRQGTPDLMAGIAQLADKVFRQKRPGHMAEEFPHLYSADNASHWFVAQDGGQIIAIVGAMVWPALILGAATKVASIGSVATDPAYRGKGISRRLLEEAEHKLAQEQVRLVLISGDLSLYLKFGARPIGRVSWYLVPADYPASGYHLRPVPYDVDGPVVARLYEMRATRFVREQSMLETLLKLQPITAVEQGIPKTFIVEREGTPVAYLLVNHRPFGGTEASRVVEWAGDPRACLAAASTLVSASEHGVIIPVSYEDSGLLGLLENYDPVSTTPVSWLTKVIDPAGLLSDMHALWTERSTLSPPQAAALGQGEWALNCGGRQWTVDSAVMTQWIFGYGATDRPAALAPFWPVPALWPEGLNYI